MKKIMTIYNVHLASVGISGDVLTYVVKTPNKKDLFDLQQNGILDGLCIDDNVLKNLTLPDEPGFYAATLEVWLEKGYMDGYPTPSESDYDIILKNLRELEVRDSVE